ncbi:MAG: cupin domain-containing protein [Candidatus Omnitrophica bacterium]|nr:cupin domain-containing protein [Candidatus Omnitrophota bacterium]
MADIKIQKLTKEELAKMGVFSWPIWEKESSRFDWKYDSVEQCYLLEGDVTVTYSGGKPVRFGKGDFVTFSKGLACIWDIKIPVKKHYNFK